MKARRLIESSIYQPETLQTAFKAFDDAWAEIAHHFDGHAEDARARLAHAVLIVTREDSDDPERLKNCLKQQRHKKHPGPDSFPTCSVKGGALRRPRSFFWNEETENGGS